MINLLFSRRTYLAATLGLLLSAGCGGGSSAPATGRAKISVAWPSPSRFVPQASVSIRVTVKDETNVVVGEAILDKPTTSVTLSPLPVGTLSATATAYPQTGAGGVAQATATAPLAIRADASTNIALTLASTIDRVSVTPTAPSLPAQTTQTLTATALDAAGQVVLTPTNGFTWSVPSGASFASIHSTTGVVTGLSAGAATIRATETESGQSGDVSATIRAAPAVSVTPASATIFLDQTKTFTASVSEIATQTVTWSVKEGAAGGSVTSAGLYSPPATPGTYTLVATSTVDSRWTKETPLTVPTPAVVFTQSVASVGVNRSTTFAARIDNLTDQRITWSVKESGGGTITSGGVYTAPATRGTYTVVATSTRDSRYKAEFSVRATAGTGIIVVQ